MGDSQILTSGDILTLFCLVEFPGFGSLVATGSGGAMRAPCLAASRAA